MNPASDGFKIMNGENIRIATSIPAYHIKEMGAVVQPIQHSLLFGLDQEVALLIKGEQEMDVANNPVVRFANKHFRVTKELHGQKFLVKVPDEKTGKIVYSDYIPAYYVSLPAGDFLTVQQEVISKLFWDYSFFFE